MKTDLKHILIEDLKLKPGQFDASVAVVTGAGRGIGLQVARAFGVLGAKVVIAELADSGRDVEKLIRAQGGQALFVKTDVSDPDSVSRMAQEARKKFGPPGILINNAILCPVQSAADMEISLWDRVMAVNLRGAFLTCKAFLPDMLKRRHGTIVNMVSPNPMPGLSAYIASKLGILGFSQTMALEVTPLGVNVIALGPGMVDTPAIREAASELAPRLGMTKQQFLEFSLHPAYQGLMPPEHAGAATVYLVAKLAAEYSGQQVDGYEILERAGFIPGTNAGPAGASRPRTGIPGKDALPLARKLEAMLDETGEEFRRLPAFIRPMARNGFRSKAGMALESWQRLAAEVQRELKAAKAPSQPDLYACLEKLIVYFRDVPRETARFSKDQDFLRQVSETSARRVETLEALLAALR
jgi:NAD(P)-dependent dehydrogenase (short-subunit alcohol dehydrogenase family)